MLVHTEAVQKTEQRWVTESADPLTERWRKTEWTGHGGWSLTAAAQKSCNCTELKQKNKQVCLN